MPKLLQQDRWYRIPGYNGYEYCYGLRLVRSFKRPRRKPGYVLKYVDGPIGCRQWTLTSDENYKEVVSEDMIRNLLESADVVIDGTDAINYGGRRHLKRHTGYHQTSNRIEPSEKKEYADFSYFFK